MLEAATSGGAAALGIGSGRIAPGEWADFVAIKLGSVPLAGEPSEGLLEAIIFGGGNEVVAGTFVAGKWRAAD